MKLFKEKHLGIVPATLDDIKAWAKGMDLAVVPLEPTQAMFDAAAEYGDIFDGTLEIYYSAMIKAAGEGG